MSFSRSSDVNPLSTNYPPPCKMPLSTLKKVFDAIKQDTSIGYASGAEMRAALCMNSLPTMRNISDPYLKIENNSKKEIIFRWLTFLSDNEKDNNNKAFTDSQGNDPETLEIHR